MTLDRPPRFHDFFVVAHPREGGVPVVLFLPAAGGWALPCWAHDARGGRTARELDDPFWPAAVQREVRRALGLEATVLHADLHDSRDPATGDRGTVMVLEVQEIPQGTWVPPPGSRWAARGDLGSLPLAMPWHRGVLERWFAEADESGGVGETPSAPPAGSLPRPPWRRPGWYATAVQWIEAQLRRHGLVPTGPAEQLGTKLARYLLRVPTAAGFAYFKALPAMYAREPQLLQLLAGAHPDRVPVLLAADADRHWLLARDHGGVSLEAARDLRTWEDALRAFAALQLAAAESPPTMEALLRAGCPDLRLEGLVGRAEALLADHEALLLDEPGGPSAAEVRALRACGPRLRTAADRLRRYGVPDTLVHGDFLPGNVAVATRGPVFLDWCEASVSHPFFSAVRFLASAEWDSRPVRAQPDLSARLRDAYLEPWERYGARDHLSQAFALAQALQPLHHALTYQHLWHLLAAETPAARAWERRTVAAQSLKRLLDQRDGLLSG